MKPIIRNRRGERGITIMVVVVMLIALLGMAALAVDVVTLYEAHGEAQRAADAAALSAARVFATSGYTSNPSSFTVTDLCQTGASSLSAAANQLALQSLAQNLIAKAPANLQNLTCNFASTANPQVTVTVHRTGLPSFFARIWGVAATSVSASATAEAYNPSGSTAPIQVTGVKPILISNCAPPSTVACPGPLINTDRTLTGGGNYVGLTILLDDTSGVAPAKAGQYYRLDIPAPPLSACPAATVTGCSNISTGSQYFQEIACSSPVKFKCGDSIGPNAGDVVQIDPSIPIDPTANAAAQCLTHANNVGLGQGQDAFNGGPVITVDGGANNPDPNSQGVLKISRSDSIITVPIYDQSVSTPCSAPGNCTTDVPIMGFAQLGIEDVRLVTGRMNAIILNVSACPLAPSGPAVTGGGVSPVPVRLIR